MAILYIAEFNFIGGGGNHPVSGVQMPPIAQQQVVIGAGSLQSTALNVNTTLVRINCDVPCLIAFGTNPNAVGSQIRLAGNQTEYFSVPPGSNFKIATITVA